MSVTRRVILTALLIILLVIPVCASESVCGSIRVVFQPDARFQILQVAVLSDGTFTPAPSFPDFSWPSGSISASDWRELTEQVSQSVGQSGTLPVRTAITGADGQAVFDRLPNGIYLLTADSFSSDGQLLEIADCLVLLRDAGAVTVTPKYSSIPEEGPNTGDAAEPELWACRLLLSALGCLFLLKRKPRLK